MKIWSIIHGPGLLGYLKQWGREEAAWISGVHPSLLLPPPLGRDSPLTVAATSPATGKRTEFSLAAIKPA